MAIDMKHEMDRLAEQFAKALDINPGGAKMALVNAEKALRKIVKRDAAKGKPELEFVDIRQTRGPHLEFMGKLLAEASTERAGKARWQHVELWETQGGNLVAVIEGRSDVEGEQDIVKASVIDGGMTEAHADASKGPGPIMRRAVIEALDWSPVAREMLRDQLGWTFTEEVR